MGAEQNIKFNEIEVYDGKSLADIFREIHQNTKDKSDQINILIQELSPLIKNVTDAVQLIPYIKDYLDVGVKNNEHLVKMAAVIQRSMPVEKTTKLSNTDDDYIIPQAEKDELIKIASELAQEKKTELTIPIISNTIQK